MVSKRNYKKIAQANGLTVACFKLEFLRIADENSSAKAAKILGLNPKEAENIYHEFLGEKIVGKLSKTDCK